jgi:hypothetical protein
MQYDEDCPLTEMDDEITRLTAEMIPLTEPCEVCGEGGEHKVWCESCCKSAITVHAKVVAERDQLKSHNARLTSELLEVKFEATESIDHLEAEIARLTGEKTTLLADVEYWHNRVETLEARINEIITIACDDTRSPGARDRGTCDCTCETCRDCKRGDT